VEQLALPLPKFHKLVNDFQGSKQVLFANIGMKLNSKGGLDTRLFVLTESHIHVCRAKNMALRDSLALDQIASIRYIC
jgi:hypothetical protein